MKDIKDIYIAPTYHFHSGHELEREWAEQEEALTGKKYGSNAHRGVYQQSLWASIQEAFKLGFAQSTKKYNYETICDTDDWKTGIEDTFNKMFACCLDNKEMYWLSWLMAVIYHAFMSGFQMATVEFNYETYPYWDKNTPEFNKKMEEDGRRGRKRIQVSDWSIRQRRSKMVQKPTSQENERNQTKDVF